MERAFEPLVAFARSLFLFDELPVPVEAEVDAIVDTKLCYILVGSFETGAL